MDHSGHNRIVSFIWGIADDCLRDVFVRGKYRDVILPMFVLRRLDCLLEPTKEKVLAEVEFQREEANLIDLDPIGLCKESGYVFYNTSQFTLKSLLGNPTQLAANFENYIDGFSDNVKEIIVNFDLRNQVRKMVNADILHDVIEKFVSEEINLRPHEHRSPDGKILPALTNLGMGYVFEELIRKFNEENNEEAGEHFTPREVIELMTHIVFDPVKSDLPPVLTIYDPACGSGGMLTEAQNFIIDPDGAIKSTANIYLYGKEVNPETFAICKSDMMIKGNNPENIRLGSTLATNEFSGMRFDFMLSNPPYGKSWATDQKHIKDGKTIIDKRFQVKLKNFDGIEEDVDATPRSSDGQLLFLMEMVGKMKSLADSPNGSRIATVHNGSALFTGDAGGGESNIRRHIIENDSLEAIIQLPNNLFYNTGITTYIWVVTNNKPTHRKGKVQLINAQDMYEKRRKNLGQKNCDLAPKNIAEIMQIYFDFKDDGLSKIFDNADFGYYKVVVERPLRKSAQFAPDRIKSLRFAPALQDIMAFIYDKFGDDVYSNLKAHREFINDYIGREKIELNPKQHKDLLDEKTWNAQAELLKNANALMGGIGQEEYNDFNIFIEKFESAAKKLGLKFSASEKNQILNAISWRDENAAKIVKKIHKFNDGKLNELLEKLGATKETLQDYGYWTTGNSGEYIEYETDAELRDNENIALKENIHQYFTREVRPHVEDAWLDISQTKIGYEISFNKYFYKHQPLRSLEEVTKEILELEKETDGLLKRLVTLSFDGVA